MDGAMGTGDVVDDRQEAKAQGAATVLRNLLKRGKAVEMGLSCTYPTRTMGLPQFFKYTNADSKNCLVGGAKKASKTYTNNSDFESGCLNFREKGRRVVGRVSSPGCRPFDEHLRAKRARVENIIRGMSSSPIVAARDNDVAGDSTFDRHSPSPADGEVSAGSSVAPGIEDFGNDGDAGRASDGRHREHKRKQRLPQQQQHLSRKQEVEAERRLQKLEERRRLKQQLEDLQRQLRQLQEKFFQVYESSESEPEEVPCESDSGSVNGVRCSSPSMVDCFDSKGGKSLGQVQNLDQVRRRNDGNRAGHSRLAGAILLEESGELGEVLKRDLNTAMAGVVDTVVNMFSSRTGTGGSVLPVRQHGASAPQPTVNGDVHGLHLASRHLQCFNDATLGDSSRRGHPSSQLDPLEHHLPDQTEALPLVVRKTSPKRSFTANSISERSAAFTDGPLGFSSAFSNPALHPFGLPMPLLAYTLPKGLESNEATKAMGHKEPGMASPELLELAKDLAGPRSKARNPPTPSPALTSSSGEGMSISLVKSECGELQDAADISLYSAATISFNHIQEGLTPNHLKKAKLMFFYTRYPSSNMLKVYFPDVKFNRCITSQLIKWFSNFREFYYIQMEKFARQTLTDGATSTDDFAVTRDSEILRVINIHYNKANDFEVPDRFMEVANVTFREFFTAIQAGKDADPSWKKAIYKIICKLDSDVPEIFRSPNCLQELLQE
uniref:Prospero homeobox 1a n=1 Tax=Eptatretus burgeri TaxID=7764 RepID=A0A8C4N5K7_EPTBU